MSIISGTIGALGTRKSAEEQNQLTQQQNADTLLLEMAARGAPLTGSNVPASVAGTEAAILPYYFGGQEKSMSADATELYKAIQERNGSPGLQIANYDALLGKYQPSVDANDQLAADLASGRMTNQTLAEAQPVFNARTNMAESKRNAGLEALRQTLSEIDSIQAGKGYSGDSTGKRMARFNARREIGTQSAADFAGANLANAQEKQAIQSGGRSLQLSNINLPDTLARAAINRTRLPGQAATATQGDAMAPFDFFKLQPANYKSPNPLNAMPDTAGSIANTVAQTGAAIGGSLAKYYSNKSLANMAQNQASWTPNYAPGPGTWESSGTSMYNSIPYGD
jgi:hypothetical protein